MAKLIYITNKEVAITQIDGVSVNLTGKPVVRTIPASKTKPEQKMEIPGVTQPQLNALLNNPEKYGDWSASITEVKEGEIVNKK